MKILVGHNFYNQAGGEDAVFKTEVDLLRSKGHKVITYERNNKELNKLSPFQKTKYLFSLDWSKKSYQEITELIKKEQPDVAHFHNIYFMLSPSVYCACRENGVPVVQSLHNFRVLCPNGLLFRNGRVDESCMHHSLVKCVLHGCYRNSKLITAFVARMLSKHRKRKTWHSQVNAYITATDFTRQKHIEGGLPGEKIFIKPNFIYPEHNVVSEDKDFALYIGRLSSEKGVEVLVNSWGKVKGLPLKIVGDGPLRKKLENIIKDKNIKNIELLGFAKQSEYERLMTTAKMIIIPSTCYENFPRIAAEAFSYGIPVVASKLGSLAEIVTDQLNGCHFEAGNSQDLAQKVNNLVSKGDLSDMRQAALNTYNEKYAADKNYQVLISIYQKAIESS